MTQVEATSSPDLSCAPRKTPRVQYSVFQVYSNWQHVTAAGSGWVPAIDLFETKTEFIVEISLAGVEPEAVKLEFRGDQLRVSGHRHDSRPSQLLGYHVMEIDRGHFERVIEIPGPVDPHTARAESYHGMLQLRVKKSSIGYTHGSYPADSMEGLE